MNLQVFLQSTGLSEEDVKKNLQNLSPNKDIKDMEDLNKCLKDWLNRTYNNIKQTSIEPLNEPKEQIEQKIEELKKLDKQVTERLNELDYKKWELNEKIQSNKRSLEYFEENPYNKRQKTVDTSEANKSNNTCDSTEQVKSPEQIEEENEFVASFFV